MSQPQARGRWIIGSLTAAAVLVGLGLIAWVMWLRPEPLPPVDAPREQLVAFAATERFANLDAERKQRYLDAMQSWSFADRRAAVESANLTDDQRREAMRNTMRPMMIKRVEGYFSLAGEAERDAYLDKMIDEMETMRAAARAGQALSRLAGSSTRPSSDGNASGPRGPSPERQKEMLEDLAPDQRAKMAAFMSAVQERRRERGLPDWQPGPPPR
jgi:hypothetical protein